MPPIDIPFWLTTIYLFVFGAVIGSFLNVCIYRIPTKEKFWESLKGLWSPPSRCPGCFRSIPIYDNIPIFGWLKLRGRCRFCQIKISPRYPLIELLNGLLFVAVYWLEIPDWPFRYEESSLFVDRYWSQAFSASWLDSVYVLHLRYLYHLVLIEALVVATFIDFDLRIIPDGSTLPAMAVGVLGGLLVPQMHIVPLWFQSPNLLHSFRLVTPEFFHPLLDGPHVFAWFAQYPHLHGLLISLAGLVIGGGVVWAVRLIGFWVLKREAMGFGDVILMAMIGSFLGWQATVAIFFIAPACALLVVAVCWIFWRDREIPYGPYISLATILMLFAWPSIWPVVERIFCMGPILFVLAFIMAVMLFVTLYAMQGIKVLLGIPLYRDEDPWFEEWNSADQLNHFAGEKIDEQEGQWRREQWPGSQSGRSLQNYQSWRDSSMQE